MKVLIICGPTATGKTALALRLAIRFNGELVNADSRQVYRGLDALTGKDRSPDIPIHLYDVNAPDQEFSAMHFVRLAQMAIDGIHKSGKLPIVVGGTGFYLQALTTFIETLTIPPNLNFRKALHGLTIEELQKRLQHIDQDRWDGMNDSDRKNLRRLIRAIEVSQSAKQKPWVVPRYDALWIGLSAPLLILKERIAKRVAERFDKAVTEVRVGLPPILGAVPLLSFKTGNSTREEALNQWARQEYQYARRQMTWFKKQKNINWFDVSGTLEKGVEQLVAAWYTN